LRTIFRYYRYLYALLWIDLLFGFKTGAFLAREAPNLENNSVSNLVNNSKVLPVVPAPVMTKKNYDAFSIVSLTIIVVKKVLRGKNSFSIF
jgi:hypothetical protein